MGQSCAPITQPEHDLSAAWAKPEIDLPPPPKEKFMNTEPPEGFGVHLEAEPEPELAKLTVAIVGARGLRNADWLPGTGKSDPYCIFKTGNKEKHRTKTIDDSLEPVWNEEVQVEDYIIGQGLEFSVWDQDAAGMADSLGLATLDFEVFKEGGFNGEIQLQEAGNGTVAYIKVKIKLHESEFPRGPPPAFECTIVKNHGKVLGLKLDTQDGKTPYVTDVEDGPCSEYNKTAKHERQLRKGDFIIAVNNTKDNSNKMLEQIKKDEQLVLSIKRSAELNVVIDRENGKKKLGLEFRDPAGYSLIITKVTANGAVDDWNKANSKKQVRAGDRVVAVAGLGGKAADLHKRICKLVNFQFTVVRPVETDEHGHWKYW